MKRVTISSKRQTREYISNQHQENDLHSRMVKSKCIDYRNNSEIIELGNGYSKIIAKDRLKIVK
ncbi:hypothetical protein [Anaerotignum sp.]|uniref:hypothetical protein n=1 Tax=Anaerotignum sp. TaxID=2039241 RepID=UPI0028A2799C|nr:hypothetical protein [Anaerotignum sp.]